MMQGEKISPSDLREAQERGRAAPHAPAPALVAAVRRLERRAADSPALARAGASKALDIAINALEEAERSI